MSDKKISTYEAGFYGLMCLIAPVLFSVSVFFWKDGEYLPTGAVLMNLSMVFWVPVMFYLFGLIKEKAPLYYCIGLVYALYGTVIGGTAFGYLGFFTNIFEISHREYLEKLATHTLGSNLLLFWAGPAFPLSLLILSIVLLRKKALETWICILLMIGAILFPVSRILRIISIAHIADVFLSVPIVCTGWTLMKKQRSGTIKKPIPFRHSNN
ncbi:hypothetical protein [Pollutibacter soli]|uniref:hypothetical protein n=1 Tax=Pollutibacter soli TaxID=3034157 RepID=UPI003013B74B